MSFKKSTALRKLAIKYEPKNKTKIKNLLLVGVALFLSVFLNLQAKGIIKTDGLENLYSTVKNNLKAEANAPFKYSEAVCEVIAKTEQGIKKTEMENPFKDACLPINSTVTSPFGYRKDPFSDKTVLHRGTDLKAKEGTEVKAVLNGKVLAVGDDEIGGKFLKLQHENGFISYYGHLSKIEVSEGEKITKGQLIALTGKTGKVTGEHLHFQLSYKDRYVNPEVYFNFNEE